MTTTSPSRNQEASRPQSGRIRPRGLSILFVLSALFLLGIGWLATLPDKGSDVSATTPTTARPIAAPAESVTTRQPGGQLITITGRTMGTTWSAKWPHQDARPTSAIKIGVQQRLDLLESQLSTWRSDSDLSKFNRSMRTDWQPCPEQLSRLVSQTLRVSEKSRGALDPTAFPLVRLWGFGPRKPGDQLREPSDADLQTARQRVDHTLLSSREHPPGIRKQNGHVALDLSATAKGFATDVVSDWLTSQGIRDHLVEVGGELKAKGTSHHRRPWRVAIESPVSGDTQHHLSRIVELSDIAIATSGDYRQQRLADGKRISHIIDPRSGQPIDHGLTSVSVMHPSGAAADGWATALLVLGREEGLALADSLGLAARFVQRTPHGFKVDSTTHFPRPGDQAN